MVGGQTGALISGSHFMLPLLDQCVWWMICHSKFALQTLQDQISRVIFLRKVYKSLATRKKRGHSKTIKQSSNSPSKVINIKSSFKMIMPKISFFQITLHLTLHRGLKRLFRCSNNIQVFSSTSSPVASAFKKECKSYEALPDAPVDVDQLLWWQHHQEQFPLLSCLAQVVFAVLAASSKSERFFSVAGNIVTPLRNVSSWWI